MAKITLNIYADDRETIEKQYTAEGYDLTMGTLEDFVQLIDIDRLNDPNELAKMILKAYGQVKDLLQDVFHGAITDEHWRRVRISDLIFTITQVGHAVLENVRILSQGNARRA